MKKTILSLILSFLCFYVLGQVEKQPLDTALSNIYMQTLLFPQEKIYMQTDKPYYITGETIFFRNFLLDAYSHKESDISRYVYVELINPIDSVIIRHQILPEDSLSYGSLIIPEDLPQGVYKMRAYTRFMTNLPADYFYSQYIQITDPQIKKVKTEAKYDFLNDKEVEISLRFVNKETDEILLPDKINLRLNTGKTTTLKPKQEEWFQVKYNLSNDLLRTLHIELNTDEFSFQQYLRIPYPDDKFEVSFFPEGGHLIVGQASAVAFKALQSNGEPAIITGEIFNSKGEFVAKFTSYHDGMGYFNLTPDLGESYYAVCTKDDQSVQIDLPKPRNDVFSLKASWRQDQLWIMVNKPIDLPWQKLYILAHSRGQVSYLEAWDSTKECVIIDKQNFHSGVNHLLLFTENFEPVSERLIFNLNDDAYAQVQLQTDKSVYKKRDLVQLNVALDKNGLENLAGNFSISITDDNDVRVDTTSTILSTFLLTSELKGYIHNPAYYFQKNNRRASVASDLLMMTHGWNRYDIPGAMKGNFQQFTIPNEESKTVSGYVKGGLLSKLYEGARVSLMSLLYGFSEVQETDEQGRFHFSGFEFPDQTTLLVQALSKRGSDLVELFVDKEVFPTIYPFRYSPLLEDSPFFENYTSKADLKYTYENGMRMINLDEVVVKASRKKVRKFKSPYYSEPDFSMSQEEIERVTTSDIRHLLIRLPGVNLAGDNLTVRGGAPLIVIDGIKMFNPDDWQYVNAFDVAQIDVIRDPGKLVVYGTNNGVIEIFTKEGGGPSNKNKYNAESLRPIGYHIPVEFYSPKYDTPEALKNQTPDLRSTIYWKPDAKLDASGVTSLDFYTADSPSTYSIVIEGISKEGKLIYHRETAAISISE